MNQIKSRRQFLKRSLLTLAAVPVVSRVAYPQHAHGLAIFGAPTPPVDPASPTAAALGYVEDFSKVDKVKFSRFQAGQDCSNCMFYSAGGQKVEGKPGEWGACQIFVGSLVNAKGWCNSYAPKPK